MTRIALQIRCAAAAVLLLPLAGCMDGPFFQLAHYNPYYRKQWDADESYRPTYYSRMADLESLRKGARQMDAERQRVAAEKMNELVQTDENPLFRRAAVRVLSEIRTAEALDGLRLGVKDADAMVRMAACEAWQARGGDEAVEVLAGVVGSDENQDVRMAATRGLAEFKDPRAVRALSVALEDGDPALQFRAMKSLASATGKQYGTNASAWRDYLAGGSPPERGDSVKLTELLPDWF